MAADDTVKILDFGLAKALESGPSLADVANSPTLSHMATQAGVLLGTAAYMPPEQAKGKSAATMRYAGKNPDPQQVGKDLHVDAVLTGTVQQNGDIISIDAELVNSTDDSQIWGEQISEGAIHVSMLQQEIVRDISSKLRMKLSPAEQQEMSQAPTENPAAYRAYVLGLNEWARLSGPQNAQKAIS